MPDQTSPGFTPKQLDKTVVAIPLLEDLEEEKVKLGTDPHATPKLWKVVIDVNLEYGDGRAEARAAAAKLIKAAVASHGRNKDQGVNERKSERSPQYLFAALEGDVIREVVRRNDRPRGRRKAAVNTVERAIFRIWPDFPIGRL